MIFRACRVARALRLARGFAGMRRLFDTLLVTLPGFANVGGLLLLFIFIFAAVRGASVRRGFVAAGRCVAAVETTIGRLWRGEMIGSSRSSTQPLWLVSLTPPPWRGSRCGECEQDRVLALLAVAVAGPLVAVAVVARWVKTALVAVAVAWRGG